jgi:organic hydroperoxide reductase OsmC/OhrA
VHSVASDPLVRHGKVRWLCDPPHGVARLRVDSDAFTALPLSIPNGDPNAGETTPGELLAVAYSAFMATDLAERLELGGMAARELVVQVWCRLSSDSVPRAVEGIEVKVQGRVPGIDDEQLGAVARVALASCHKSVGMRRDLPTKLNASLAH